MNHTHNYTALRARQSGVALIISLILLVVLTLIGLSAATNTVLQERMAGNTRDKNISFQASETAARAGETWISNQGNKTPSSINCSEDCNTANLLTYDSPILTNITLWSLDEWDINSHEYGTVGTTDLPDVSEDPRFVLEEVSEAPGSLKIGGNPVSRHITYRVTALGVGSADTTQTIVETMYAKSYFGKK